MQVRSARPSHTRTCVWGPRVLLLSGFATFLVACSDLPSKSDVLEIVRHEVKEDAQCTIPVTVLSSFKAQYTTKSICIAKEGGPPADTAMACLDAFAAAGLTKRRPASYMAEWPDEISGAGFDSVSPYDRRARNLVFRGCVELTPGLREGQFGCGEAKADSIVSMKKTDDTHAVVRYARAITPNAQLAAIEAACGAATRPAPEGTITIAKTPDKKWVMATSAAPFASASSTASPP